MVRGRTRRAGGIAVLLAAALALTACTGTARPHDPLPSQSKDTISGKTAEALGDAVEKAVELSGSTGAIVGVWAPWSGSWTDTPGSASTGGDAPMSADMHFRAAAATPALTCTVLLRLAEKGKVGLDDPVTKYLPRMSDVKGITLRQLCRNTSGMGDYRAQLAEQFVDNPTRQYPALELVTDGLGAPKVGAPGEKWSRSDAGLVLLGLAVRRATGEDWSDLYRDNVFRPLGMGASSLPDEDDASLPSPHPHGYAYAIDDDGARVCKDLRDDTRFSASAGSTAAGVVSSLADLKTFAQALAAGSLLSNSSKKAQWKTVAPGSDAPSWQGYGLGAATYGPMRGGAGAVPGSLTAMLSDPKSGLTVVVMLNNSSAGQDFALQLALELTSIAAKAPAASGQKAPDLELPWSQKQAATALKGMTVCPENAKKSDKKSDEKSGK